MKTMYPAIFHSENNGYWVEFPDLEGCFTQGDTMEETITMSEEALGLYLIALEESKQAFPNPSNPAKIKVESDDDFVSIIAVNINMYRRDRAVKKTLTIPRYLNDEATKRGCNFSQILQNALADELQMSRPN